MKDAIGFIGGSGIYSVDCIENPEFVEVHTPFGKPSDELCRGTYDGSEVYFLPRHGRGHRIPPSELNFHANIHAFKQNNVKKIISVSAVGSLKEELAPGTFVIVDQFIDRAVSRNNSFFTEGLVAHVSMADPVCPALGDAIEEAAKELSIPYVRGGTYLVMQGPQFSTRAESNLYRSWGCDVIGMTNMPEAKLAREAEMCFATVAMVTDYDCWHDGHENVSVEAVIKVLNENAEKARALISKVIPKLAAKSGDCKYGCNHALENAIITAPDVRDPAVVDKLRTVAGRVL